MNALDFALRAGRRSGDSFTYPGATNVTAAYRNRVRTNWTTKDEIIVGDSTTAGFGSGTSGGWTGSYAKAPPRVLAELQEARSLVAANDSWFGDGGGGTVAVFGVINPANVVGASWAISNNPAPTARGLFLYDNSGTDLMTYTSIKPCTGFLVHYRRTTGSFSVQIDSETAQTWDMTATFGGVTGSEIQRRLITASGTGIHALKINRISGEGLIAGVEAIAPTDRKDVINLGWSGARAADWVNNVLPTAPLGALGTIVAARTAPLCLISLGINDQNGGRTDVQYGADLVTIGNRIIASGGIPLVVVQQPTNTTPSEAYAAAARAAAVTLGCACFDLRPSMGTWAQMGAKGWTYGDSSHLSFTGSAAVAASYDSFLAALVGG